MKGPVFSSGSSWIERAQCNRSHQSYGAQKTEKGLEVQRQGDSRVEAEGKETDRAEVNVRCPSIAKEFQMPPDL